MIANIISAISVFCHEFNSYHHLQCQQDVDEEFAAVFIPLIQYPEAPFQVESIQKRESDSPTCYYEIILSRLQEEKIGTGEGPSEEFLLRIPFHIVHSCLYTRFQKEPDRDTM